MSGQSRHSDKGLCGAVGGSGADFNYYPWSGQLFVLGG